MATFMFPGAVASKGSNRRYVKKECSDLYPRLGRKRTAKKDVAGGDDIPFNTKRIIVEGGVVAK